jgi:uncharacterized peroxidase-related enzyme
MALIDTIPPDEAEGDLAEAYDEILEERGAVANVYQVHSLLPDTMLGHKELYMSLLYGSGGLSRAHRELVAVVVSAENGCDYCVQHHSDALNRYWDDRERVEALAGDPESADLEPRQEALVGWARQVTHRPHDAGEVHVEMMGEAGLSDEEILDVTLVAAYFNFVNRVVLALDVETEEVTDDPDYKY